MLVKPLHPENAQLPIFDHTFRWRDARQTATLLKCLIAYLRHPILNNDILLFPGISLISSEFVPSYTIVTIPSGPSLTPGEAVAGISVFSGAGDTRSLTYLRCRRHTWSLAFSHLVFRLYRNLNLATVFLCSITACTVAFPFLMPFTVRLFLALLHNLHILFALLTFHFAARLLFFSFKNFFAPTTTFCCHGRVTLPPLSGVPVP